ncbi:DUF1835 domain-containing protein [Bacillus sp. BRMEA1]|uniref:DUF1835 domain-containing protein n=1 Tax=Neobacillus endophyticus TaxID=2738405 RepID=UPI00156657BE|nr:DUF1835 domain-containing protein [Neobacillus endophyticus]NRD81123.1 DUF1835 domain-containing protein [Neobacillus endophyticus]
MEIEKINKVVKELPERDARLLLNHILKRIHLLNENEYSEKRFIEEMKRAYQLFFGISEQRQDKIEGPIKVVHILFGASPAGCLKQALKELGAYKDEKVICIKEMFSFGPIWKFNEEVGKQSRYNWLQNNLSDEDVEFDESKESFNRAVNQIMSIKENIPIYLWAAENAEEQTGLRFVVELLKEKNNDIFAINTTKAFNNLFNKGKRKHTIFSTGELAPDKLQAIYKQMDEPPLTQHEQGDFEKEWLSLTENKETLRIWRNGRIEGAHEDYYDEFIINRAKKLHGKRKTNEFFKSARLIGDVLGHLDHFIWDLFLEYRLKKMIENGVFEAEGSLEAMRLYSVRLKQKQLS